MMSAPQCSLPAKPDSKAVRKFTFLCSQLLSDVETSRGRETLPVANQQPACCTISPSDGFDEPGIVSGTP
jgi:hypothetical protein